MVRFPSKIRISSVTRDFINRLLKKLPKDRIGQNEFHQITTHHFFQSANVNSVLNQKITAPITPNISGDPLGNFDNIYTNQPIEDFNDSKDAGVLDQIGDLFEDFKNGI